MSPKPTLLITGATGHIGFATLLFALKNGYRARVSIRKAEQEARLRENAHLEPYSNGTEFVVVPDIGAPGAFDSAVIDIEYIIHGASPIPTTATTRSTDYKTEFVEPATAGVIGILESANKSPSVKRIVITSSIVALDVQPGKLTSPTRLAPNPTEADIDAIQDPRTAYRVSKKLAHNAAASFVQHHHPSFSIIWVLPAYVQGPNLLHTKSSEMDRGSNDILMEFVTGKRHNPTTPATTSLVHIDDASRAHVLALDPSRAKNLDAFLLVGNGGKNIDWNTIPTILNQHFPKEIKKGLLANDGVQMGYSGTADISAAVEMNPGLGMGELKGLESMVLDTVGQFLELKKVEESA